jgi:hypothetical protein
MKRRRRTDDSSLPVVTKRPDGKLAVEVAEGCFINWWCERRNDREHWFVQLRTPVDVPINEVPDGAIITTPLRH